MISIYFYNDIRYVDNVERIQIVAKLLSVIIMGR